MKGYPTSYAGMFTQTDEAAPSVASIEIPLIQRDYAQGRVTPRVDEIRSTFSTLCTRRSPAASRSAWTSSTARSTTGRSSRSTGNRA